MRRIFPRITAENAENTVIIAVIVVHMMWIHTHSAWPNLTWDAASLASKLAAVRHHQGRLLGRMEGLGFELQREASFHALTKDVVKSSAIEGEDLNVKEVRSSIARRLGMDIGGLISTSRHVDGVVDMMLDATQHFAKPLTKNRLFAWHAALFPTGRSGLIPIKTGGWRTPQADPMQVVSGAIGREKIHFEAPRAARLEKEMKAFLAWLNKDNSMDSVLKAGMAHFRFVTIHPFEDGNGRIARAIGDMALARADRTPHRFYSLSSQIEAERKDYYNQLERQQRSSPDITDWLAWFLACLGRAIAGAETSLGKILFKAQLWDTINREPVNKRQRLIINRMLEDSFKGHMNTSTYAKLSQCSHDTALRDIQALKARGIFIQNADGGRSTSYRLAAYA